MSDVPRATSNPPTPCLNASKGNHTPNAQATLMDELHERAKGYIQMEEMFRFWNEVCHAGQKCNECKAHTKPDAHKSDKRHKPDKRQPLSKGSRYECYTPLMVNHTMILEETFNLDVPI
ncbi:hypothetical protein JHK85_010301 [Glycine max]|nr:hypothetical protein JHK85_010301 [Glycine max]